MRTFKKVSLGILAAIATYLVIGLVLSKVIFPHPTVDFATYFKPGDVFGSSAEGFRQTVLAVNDGWLHTRLEIMPHAAGPPEHLHENFEERFTVREGTVSILVNGEKRTLRAGESIRVPPMTPHKPFNETDQIAVAFSKEDVRSIPTNFGYYLSQIYPVMDQGRGDLAMLMQTSVYGSDMDSWLAGGPPIAVQKALRFLLEPAARLLGFQYYYEENRPKRS